jgi:hypothetical protein
VLEKQPNMSLFCKPKIKSTNLLMLERLRAEVNTQEAPLADVINGRL